MKREELLKTLKATVEVAIMMIDADGKGGLSAEYTKFLLRAHARMVALVAGQQTLIGAMCDELDGLSQRVSALENKNGAETKDDPLSDIRKRIHDLAEELGIDTDELNTDEE